MSFISEKSKKIPRFHDPRNVRHASAEGKACGGARHRLRRGRRCRYLPRLPAGGRPDHHIHVLSGTDADDPGYKGTSRTPSPTNDRLFRQTGGRAFRHARLSVSINPRPCHSEPVTDVTGVGIRNLLAGNLRKSAGIMRFGNGLPRQSADWLAMTGFFDRLWWACLSARPPCFLFTS